MKVPDSNLRTVAIVREVLMVLLLIVFVPFLSVSVLFLIVFVLFVIVSVLLLIVFHCSSVSSCCSLSFILFLCVYKVMAIRLLEEDHDIVQSVFTHSIFICLSTL